MHFYAVYGLVVSSEILLPELSPEIDSPPIPPDVSIRLGTFDHARPPGDAGKYLQSRSPEIITYVPGIGSAKAIGGRDLIIQPEGDMDEPFRGMVLCQAFAVILLQRNMLVLHASAVQIGGSGVAFVGVSGQGKSTIAAACGQAGHPILADDVIAVGFENGGPVFSPGIRRLKLDLEAGKTFGLAAERHQGRESRRDYWRGKQLYSPVSAGHERVALKCVYVLGSAETIKISSLSPRDALLSLCHHSYGNALLQPMQLSAWHLKRCSALANSGKVRHLVRPRDLEALPEAVRAVENDELTEA